MTQAELATKVLRAILRNPALREAADALRCSANNLDAARVWDARTPGMIVAIDRTGFGWNIARGFFDGIYMERAGYGPGFSWHKERAPEIAPDYLCVLGRQYVTAPHRVLAVAGLGAPDDNQVDE